MSAVVKTIWAPFSAAQVDALNKYQQNQFFVPYTCIQHHPDESPKLIATREGWKCDECGITQLWTLQSSIEIADGKPLWMKNEESNS